LTKAQAPFSWRLASAHLNALLRALTRRGFTAYVRHHCVSDHVTVLDVIVPGLERFVPSTDDHVVLPGVKSTSSFGSYASGWMPSSCVEYSPDRLMCSVR
jgi:hypothetical protein